jgi:RHS repeat-associated protein
MGSRAWRRSRRAAVTSGVVAAVLAGSVVGLPPVAMAAPPAAEPTPESVVSTGPFGLQVPDMASARAVAAEKGEPVEIIAKRTDSSSTWVLPDGNLSTSYAVAPIWVREGGDGTQPTDWAPVDLTLEAAADGSVRPKAHPGDLVLAGGGGPADGRLLSMSGLDGKAITLAWDGALPTPLLDGPRATYPQVQPGVDLVVEATRTGYEQFFILTDAPQAGAAPELSLTVETDGLTAEAAADGAVVFNDADGDTVAASGTPHAWDAAVDAERLHPLTEPWSERIDAPAVLDPEQADVQDPAPATAPGDETAEAPEQTGQNPETDLGQEGTPAQVQAGASPLLPLTEAAQVTAPDAVEFTLTPDAAYLEDSDTEYPVVVDPDVTLDGWFDTWVQSNISVADQSGSPELRVGTYDGGGTVARSFLNVHMESLKYRDILDANLFLWNWDSWSCTARGWEVWTTGTASTSTRWSSQPTWVDRWGYSTQTRGYSSSCAAGWVAADVTDLIQAWSDNGRDVVGMGLKTNNETDNLGWKKFNSGNYAGGGLPHINVTYVAPPPPANGPTATVSLPESLSPTLHGVATATGTGAESMQFFARTSSSSTWNLLNGVSVSGRDAYKSLPAGQLEIGESFVYLIKHCDDGGCTASASQTGYVSPDVGAGSRPGATRIPFTIGDKIKAQVDVGTGNLLVSASQLTLRRVTDPLDLGMTWNGLTLANGSRYSSVVAPGWRFSTGNDVRLANAGNSTLVYYGPNGITGAFTYDKTVGNVNFYTSPKAIKASLTRDLLSNTYAITMHSTREKYRFTLAGQLYAIEDRNGNDTTLSYGSGGQLTSVQSDVGTPDGHTVAVDANATSKRIDGLSQSPSAAPARNVDYVYNTAGQLTDIVDVLGRTTSFTYNSGGDLASIDPPGAPATTFTYDGTTHRVATVSQPSDASPGQAVTRFKYEVDSTLVADPNTDQSQAITAVPNTTYDLQDDGRQLVAKATDPTNAERSATYNDFSDVETATNSAGTMTFGYQDNGGESLSSTKLDTGAQSSYSYGNVGPGQYLPKAGKDSQGNATTYDTDTGNVNGATNDATGAEASLERNPDGTIKNATDPRNFTTTYDNTAKQLTKVTPPAGNSLGQRTYSYDPYGRVETYDSGSGVTETYSYDSADRVTEVDYSDATASVTYTYDTAGRVHTRTDASGTTTYTYDPLGRLATRQHTAGGGVLQYEYDLTGNLVSETDGSGTTTHTYDVRNLIKSTVTPDGRTIRYDYNKDGQRIDTWFATNADNSSWAAHTKTGYDTSGRMARTWTARDSDNFAKVSDIEYSYSLPASTSCTYVPVLAPGTTDTGLRWKKTERTYANGALDQTITTNYCYDESNRLVKASTTISTTSGTTTGDVWTYQYDAAGNRIRATKNGTDVDAHVTPNSANQLVDVTSAGSFSYDGAGNLTETVDGLELSYTGSNQLKARTDVSGTSYTFAGTTQNELISQAVPGGDNYKYRWGRTDRNGLPLLESFTSPDGTSYLTHDDSGAPLALRSPTGVQAYYVLDGLGSPVALVGSDGALLATYSYDPYGEVTTSNQTGNAGDLNPYRFAGGLLDRTTGYVKFGQRFYDPGTGRFTQQDSLEVLADPTHGNRYQYAAGNPCNFVDPTGQFPSMCRLVTLLGSAALVVAAGFTYAAFVSTGSIFGAPAAPFLLGIGAAFGLVGVIYLYEASLIC